MKKKLQQVLIIVCVISLCLAFYGYNYNGITVSPINNDYNELTDEQMLANQRAGHYFLIGAISSIVSLLSGGVLFVITCMIRYTDGTVSTE